MALYAIGDLHLSLSVNKPMDLFGGNWVDYVSKLKTAWEATVSPEDTVVLAGDISWGMNLNQALADFQFIETLPGKKLIIKGNHDYFWTTVSGMSRFLAENGLTSMSFLNNSFVDVEGIAVCGTRGWFLDSDTGSKAQNQKLYQRELIRLRLSLESAKNHPGEKVVVLHYPPLYPGLRCTEMLQLMQEFGVRRCYYGHLHGRSLRDAVRGEREGINFHCISADGIQFTPERIN